MIVSEVGATTVVIVACDDGWFRVAIPPLEFEVTPDALAALAGAISQVMDGEETE